MVHDRSKVYVKHILEPTYNFTLHHFYEYILEINIAHAQMLAKQNILSKDSATKIIEANYVLLENGFNKGYDQKYEDLFFMIEEELSQEIGEDLVGDMHIAFSRNDMDATMFRMLWRTKCIEWMESLQTLQNVVLELSKEHVNTIMIAYTHNQQAQPTTLSHYLMAINHHLHRDIERGLSLLRRINVSPMGAAALGTTGFLIDRQFMANQLGFDDNMKNSYDSIAAADYMLEISSVLSTSLSTVSRFVYDLMFLATNELQGIHIDQSLVQTSSIMPQKRNPSSLEHTRALISRTIGELQGTYMMTHSVPFGDIVDIGDDIQPILHNGFQSTTKVNELLTEILANSTIQKENLYRKCDEGFSTVTELADILVRNHNLSFRKAHQVVNRFVQYINSSQQNLQDGNAQLVNKIAFEEIGKEVHLTNEEYEKAIDPRHFVKVRSIQGGPNPTEVKRQIHSLEQAQETINKQFDHYKQKTFMYKDQLKQKDF